MALAEVDIVMAHPADAAAALPQSARQLGDILARAKDDHLLEMDTTTEIDDPGLAIAAARFHLDWVGGAGPPDPSAAAAGSPARQRVR